MSSTIFTDSILVCSANKEFNVLSSTNRHQVRQFMFYRLKRTFPSPGWASLESHSLMHSFSLLNFSRAPFNLTCENEFTRNDRGNNFLVENLPGMPFSFDSRILFA